MKNSYQESTLKGALLACCGGLKMRKTKLFYDKKKWLMCRQLYFDLMKRKPMENIDNYLEDEVPEYYVVTQPSMLNKIAEGDSVFNGKVDRKSVV